MKYPIIILFLLFSSVTSFSQSVNISEQWVYGGDSGDQGVELLVLSNGEKIICALSWSNISGDKSEDGFGKSDYWIFKIDANGDILWQLTIGGSENDIPSSIIQTSDGGFLVNGTSDSPLSGNKTTSNYGDRDAWLVKVSANGQLEWQKNFGGIQDELTSSMIILPNGNIMLGISSTSGVSGNKTVDNKGGWDYWLVEMDINGNAINQYVFGGDKNDILREMSLLSNSKLILSGNSKSDISGDKTQDSFGSSDYWTVIIDLAGQVLLSSTEGGDMSESKPICYNRNDKEIVLFGKSSSGNTGSKNTSTFGAGDFWIVALDENLNRKWESNNGGDNFESLYSDEDGIYFDVLSEYIMCGTSHSGVSGNKTLPAFDMSYGDLWLVGLDTLGSKTFEFVAGGNSSEQMGDIKESLTNTVLVLGTSASGISGNKTELNKGLKDVWLIELDFNVGIEKIPIENLLEVYPNPVKTILKYNLPMIVNSTNVSLTDVSGKVVFKDKLNGVKESQIDVSSLPLGVYVLTIISNEFKYSRKIVID